MRVRWKNSQPDDEFLRRLYDFEEFGKPWNRIDEGPPGKGSGEALTLKAIVAIFKQILKFKKKVDNDGRDNN